ncbi:MAG: hypothetical protein H0V67_01380 [Geodermatophilaceae bacterium]|nr:hypothetical protein [Geodermatophilaceae bacterium]
MPDRLSRRRRFAPLAVDVAGDVAVTMFARRGVNGEVWRDSHVLCLRRDAWRVLGGGSGSAADNLLSERSSVQLDRLWMRTGSGGTNRDAGRLVPFPPPRWIRYVSLRVAAEVQVVDVAGRRRIVVPRHGTVCVVWGSRRPPTVTLLDADGDELERISAAAHADDRRRSQ